MKAAKVASAQAQLVLRRVPSRPRARAGEDQCDAEADARSARGRARRCGRLGPGRAGRPAAVAGLARLHRHQEPDRRPGRPRDDLPRRRGRPGFRRADRRRAAEPDQRHLPGQPAPAARNPQALPRPGRVRHPGEDPPSGRLHLWRDRADQLRRRADRQGDGYRARAGGGAQPGRRSCPTASSSASRSRASSRSRRW